MNRLEQIKARMTEIRGMIDSASSEEMKAIEIEVKNLSEERDLIEKRTSLLDGGIPAGARSIPNPDSESNVQTAALSEHFEGAKVYRRSQNISDVYPDKEQLSIGKYLRGAITGNWNGAAKEQNEFRALSTATANVMIPQVLSAQVIDIARKKSILFQSDVPMIEMTSNNMTISRVKTDPTFGFKAEGADSTESIMEFEGVTLNAKTAYGLLSVTIEAMQSSANLDAVVREAMAESIARTIDYACLFGQTANNEPKGVLTYTEINQQAETANLSNYSPFIKAVGKVRKKNGEPTAWALNATTDEQLNLLANSNGDVLQIPPVVDKLQRLISNQLPSNGGTGTNESTSMIYDPSSLLIGMQTPIMVEVSREAMDAWKKGLVYLRVYTMLDIAVLRPGNITKITGLKQA
jgi:HK97 family phage major capsid protein